MEHDDQHVASNGAGYEVEDASIREIIYTGIGLAVGTILVCFAVLGLFKVMMATSGKEEARTEVSSPQAFPPGPRLQAKPWEELQQVRKHEDDTLLTWGWMNKDAGIVHIPISQAMDTVLQRGLPVQASAAEGGSSRPVDGRSSPVNVPRQASGFPAKGAGNARQK